MQTKDHAPIVFNPFVIYIAFGVISFSLQQLVPLPFASSQFSRITGSVIFASGFLFGLPAFIGFLRAKTSPNPMQPTTELVLTGSYRYTRNPMYIGLTLGYIGLVTFFRIPWGLLLAPVVIWLITIWVIRPEEQYLEQKFGSDYLAYKNSTHQWI